MDDDGYGDACDDDIDGDGCMNIFTADLGGQFIGNTCHILSELQGSADDPAPTDPTISCANGCTQIRASGCGDCEVDVGEICDDGNRNTNTPSDLTQPSCRLDCTRPLCSNSIADPDDVPDTWADFDDPACHECGCDECELIDTQYLPSKNDENNSCDGPEDGFPSEEVPPVGLLRGLFQRTFGFLLANHQSAPLWSGQGCTGQDDDSCATRTDHDGTTYDYRCAPKYQQLEEWVYECKRVGKDGDTCNYNKD